MTARFFIDPWRSDAEIAQTVIDIVDRMPVVKPGEAVFRSEDSKNSSDGANLPPAREVPERTVPVSPSD
jgi:hypothetical protein